MNSSWNVVKELEADNSRLAKEAIIFREAEAGNDEFFAGCRLALDSMITFGIKQITEKQGDGPGLSWQEFKQIANYLSKRELTGNAAINTIIAAADRATEIQWNYWYRRILTKDLRCGVSEKTINNVVEKKYPQYAVPVFTCQLAHDSANYENKLQGAKIVEVKLDGVRVITIIHPDGRVEQYSRNGKELVNFPHIREQLAKNAHYFKESMVLDGEIMSGSFQDLMKLVHRKNDVRADDAVLHLFDIISLKEFRKGEGVLRQVQRTFMLAGWYNEIAESMPNVTVVGHEQVDLDLPGGQARFKEINQEAIEGGYEGIMIKDPLGVYTCSRNPNWLKMKPFIEVSLEITHIEEGTGRNQGRLGAFVCQGFDNGIQITVNVGSGFTDSDRDLFWSQRDIIIGKIIEIRADAVTQNQDSTYSLRFPRFLRFRGFEPGEKI